MLGVGAVRPEPGGVAFRGGLQVLYRANLMLRTATRVLLRLGEFHAREFDQLRRRASRLAFESCLAPDRAIRISVTCSRSRLRHTGAVEERVHQAIADRLGREVPIAGPEDESIQQLVLVRLVHDRCAVSIDASGALLHQRGWRKRTGKAPLRETLAAALLLASGWDAASPLADPFCGSGTIPIEAVLLARRLAPGRGRRFACQDWPGFDAAIASRLAAEAEASVLASGPAIRGSDRDAGAIDSARSNAEAAGIGIDVAFEQRSISDFEPPPGTGWIVCNPPYGVRLRGSGDLRDLYARFGTVLRRRCPGWRVALLCADPRLLRASELPLEHRASWRNGGLKVGVFVGMLPSTS